MVIEGEERRVERKSQSQRRCRSFSFFLFCWLSLLLKYVCVVCSQKGAFRCLKSEK